MCHQPWPWPHGPLADERRAARIAVLVGGGRVEVGGPWPHSPLADERLPLGSQSLSVVAALRSAGGLLRRGSGQLKVGLLVLGLAREQQCNAPVRTGSRSWTSLTTTARTLSLSFMRLALVSLAALADLSASSRAGAVPGAPPGQGTAAEAARAAGPPAAAGG